MNFVKTIIFCISLAVTLNLVAWDYRENLEQFRPVSTRFRKQLGIELRTNEVMKIAWNQPTNITVRGISYIWGEERHGLYLKSAETGKRTFERINLYSYPTSGIAIEMICIEPSIRQCCGRNGHYDGVHFLQDNDWLLIADAPCIQYYAAYKNLTLSLRHSEWRETGKHKPDEEMYEVLRAIVKAGLREESSKGKLEENTPAQTKENSAR